MIEKFKKIETDIKNLDIIEPLIHGDTRGFFIETYSKREFEKLGILNEFVQDNHSKSKKGVLRGLHFQNFPYCQDKLVRVIRGSILDVAVDLRKESKTFGKWVSVELSEINKKMLYIPNGFAHGFLTLEDDTEVEYKCTNYYEPSCENGILWNDPEIGIEWNLEKYGIDMDTLLLSDKDRMQQTLKEFVESGVVIGK